MNVSMLRPSEQVTRSEDLASIGMIRFTSEQEIDLKTRSRPVKKIRVDWAEAVSIS
jgi:hypothetical protein